MLPPTIFATAGQKRGGRRRRLKVKKENEPTANHSFTEEFTFRPMAIKTFKNNQQLNLKLVKALPFLDIINKYLYVWMFYSKNL